MEVQRYMYSTLNAVTWSKIHDGIMFVFYPGLPHMILHSYMSNALRKMLRDIMKLFASLEECLKNQT